LKRERQRKLDARQRRKDSLANSGIASQEPRLYPGERVSVKKLRKTYREIGIPTDQGPIRTDPVKEIKAKKNLEGIKKTAKGKGKKNEN